MQHEIVVDGFALDVEVTHCVNTPPCPGTWSSDWDTQGEREIEFRVTGAVEYSSRGRKRIVSNTQALAARYQRQIETALWFEIDSRARRQRWAA